jgi:hypothetical protein
MEISEMLNLIGTETIETEMLNWIQGDENLLPTEETEEAEAGESDKEEEDTASYSNVKHVETVKAFNLCLKWGAENNLATPDMLTLQRLKEEAFF